VQAQRASPRRTIAQAQSLKKSACPALIDTHMYSCTHNDMYCIGMCVLMLQYICTYLSVHMYCMYIIYSN
jgi:hypothetical protein